MVFYPGKPWVILNFNVFSIFYINRLSAVALSEKSQYMIQYEDVENCSSLIMLCDSTIYYQHLIILSLTGNSSQPSKPAVSYKRLKNVAVDFKQKTSVLKPEKRNQQEFSVPTLISLQLLKLLLIKRLGKKVPLSSDSTSKPPYFPQILYYFHQI